MENVNWIPAQFGAERQRNANEGSVGKSGAGGEIWPPVTESTYGLTSRNIDRVLIDRVYFGEGFDEMRRVAFISAKTGPNRVSVNCYSQGANCSLDPEPDNRNSSRNSRGHELLLACRRRL